MQQFHCQKEKASNLTPLIRPRLISYRVQAIWTNIGSTPHSRPTMHPTPPNAEDTSDPVLLKQSRVDDRYGDAGRAGWSPVPDVLLLNQHRLGINSTDLNVLLNMILHFYTPGEMPYVRPNVIAKRMGVEERTVQRSIARLRKKGLLLKAKHATGHIAHDLTPMIERLGPYARERIADRDLRKQMIGSVAQLDRAPGSDSPRV